MSDLENRFNAPRVSVGGREKSSKKNKKEEIAAANDNTDFGENPVDAIADKDIEGWTKPLEEKPIKKPRAKREKKPAAVKEKGEWKGVPEQVTYTVGPVGKTEARINREIDRDFEKNFKQELKNQTDPDLDPSIHEAFDDELKRASETEDPAWSKEVAELTAEVKKTAEEPTHGTHPTKTGRFDAEDVAQVTREQNKALDDLVKKYATPKKRGFWARLFGFSE